MQVDTFFKIKRAYVRFQENLYQRAGTDNKWQPYEVKHAILLARSKNDEKSNTFVYITFRALYTIRN